MMSKDETTRGSRDTGNRMGRPIAAALVPAATQSAHPSRVSKLPLTLRLWLAFWATLIRRSRDVIGTMQFALRQPTDLPLAPAIPPALPRPVPDVLSDVFSDVFVDSVTSMLSGVSHRLGHQRVSSEPGNAPQTASAMAAAEKPDAGAGSISITDTTDRRDRAARDIATDGRRPVTLPVPRRGGGLAPFH